MHFVDNLEAVVWLMDPPHWRIDSDVGPESYSERATTLWRSRWLSKAVARLGDGEPLVPGPFETSLAASS